MKLGIGPIFHHHNTGRRPSRSRRNGRLRVVSGQMFIYLLLGTVALPDLRAHRLSAHSLAQGQRPDLWPVLVAAAADTLGKLCARLAGDLAAHHQLHHHLGHVDHRHHRLRQPLRLRLCPPPLSRQGVPLHGHPGPAHDPADPDADPGLCADPGTRACRTPTGR